MRFPNADHGACLEFEGVLNLDERSSAFTHVFDQKLVSKRTKPNPEMSAAGRLVLVYNHIILNFLIYQLLLLLLAVGYQGRHAQRSRKLGLLADLGAEVDAQVREVVGLL